MARRGATKRKTWETAGDGLPWSQLGWNPVSNSEGEEDIVEVECDRHSAG